MWVVGLVLAVGVSGALAGANPEAKAALHLEPHESRTCAKNFPVIADQSDIIITHPNMEVDVFPVFFNLTEYQSFDYALWWPGLYSCAFTSCSDITTGTIVWPWDGVSHAWYTCKEGPIAVFAWAWITDIGCLCLMSHPTFRAVRVGDCDGGSDNIDPSDRYRAGIGDCWPHCPGCPADTVAVDPTSWGEIKSLFK
jgi:hypothetical protein